TSSSSPGTASATTSCPGSPASGRSPAGSTSRSTTSSGSTSTTSTTGRSGWTSRSWPRPCRPCSHGAAPTELRRRGDPRELLVDLLERDRELPARVVGAEAAEVRDVADVVAEPVLVDVLGVERAAVEPLERGDRLEHRARVPAPAAEVVDRGRSRALRERHHGGADVVGVDVVAHLLALVAVDPVGAALADRARQAGEEAMQLRDRG